jgi:hypothetical protein
MKLPLPLVAILAATLFAGCATPYTSNGMLGGYSDAALAPDVYRISFQGNGFTAPDRAQDFAILHAADLTLAHGYHYFGIINQTQGGTSGVINMPGQSYTYVNAQVYGNAVYGTAHTTYIPGASIPVFYPNSGLMIRCFTARPAGGFALDAAFVSRSLRAKYGIKPT